MRYYIVFKRIYFIVALLFLVSWEAKAQYDPEFAHYFDMEPSFNPASAGKEAKLNITAAYALDFAGYENNPRSFYAAADMPFYALKNYHGVGVQLMSDKIGLFTHQRIELQYAYKHKLFGGMISAGVQVGLLDENWNGSDLDVEETNDPALSSSSLDGSALDLSAGLYYVHGPWYLGVSGLHLTSPLIELGETNEYKVDATYYLTGGYNIKLRNPFLTIKPSFRVMYDGTDWREDITGRFVYTHEKKMMYAGVGYSPDVSVTFMIGGRFHGVVLGYSYEMYTSGIGPGNGSHELFVGYQTDITLIKKGRNKHKSVRIL